MEICLAMLRLMEKKEVFKFSYTVSVSQTDFEAVGKGDWRDSAQFMSSLGYTGIELAIRNPRDVEISTLQTVLQENKLNLAAIGTGQAYFDESISLSDDDKTQRDKAVTRLKDHIDLACNFDACIIIGLIRGHLGKDPVDREKRFSFFQESITEVLEYADKKNITIVIEPVNRYECDFFNRAEEIAAFLSDSGFTKAGILLDTFHMNIEESDFYDTIIRSQPFVKHVHIADSSRRYPGSGHIPFSEIIRALRETGYQGYLSGEMLPLPDLKTAITKHIEAMKEVLNEHV